MPKQAARSKGSTCGGGIDVAPNFSLDGTKIAYASERSGGSQIYILTLASGESKRVSFDGSFNTDPVFQTTAQKSYLWAVVKCGFDIFVAELETGNLYRITQDMGDNEDPTRSPDGRYLLFSSTRSGESNLLSTSDGRHQMPITRTGGWTQPSWMPEGE